MHRRLLLPDAAIAPAHSAYVGAGRSSLETNMAIILGVLLCSLISALGLNSFVRCALRCSRRFSQGRQDHSADRAVAPAGLKKRELRQIPVAAYGPGANIAATECPICLAGFVEGDRIRVLPKCRHGFHMRCIDTWLLSHSSCPNCRHELLDKTEGSGSGSGSDSCRSVPDGRRVTGTGLGPPE